VENDMPPPKLQPALLGGLFAGVLSALPFVNLANCCCLWMIAGGVLAAYIMQLNHPLPITIGNGAAVGFLAGLIGAIVSFAVDIPIRALVTPLLPELGTWRSRRSDLPPEVRDALRNIAPQVIAIVGGVIFVSIELIFSTLGGLFGALVFRKAPPLPEPPAPLSHPPITPPAGPPVESWSYPDQDQPQDPNRDPHS
jgi:hypothetical protein